MIPPTIINLPEYQILPIVYITVYREYLILGRVVGLKIRGGGGGWFTLIVTEGLLEYMKS